MNACLRFGPWLLLSLASANAAGSGLLPERVAKAAQERVDANLYPTLVFAVVDGDTSEVVGFGKLADGNAADGETVYEIGSITKTFTATLLADAVQSGKLKLDTSVATLLPDFKIPARSGKQITLLDIATQHSGLPRMPNNFAPADPANPYVDYTATKLKGFLASYELPRDPGASYEYSNLGFALLGYALAQHAHTDYAALLREKILQPLGMRMSGVILDTKMREHLATGHGDDGKAVKSWDFDVFASAGAIRSTGDDMLRYLKANMGASKTALGSAMKFAQQPRRELGKDAQIGLAWMTRGAKPNGIVSHSGATGGYTSFLGFRADGRRGVVVLTNIASSAEELGLAVLLDDAPLSPVHKAIPVDAATLDDYVGIYKLAENFLITITRKGDQLITQATGQGPFPIYPSAANEFFAKVDGISLTFKRDAQGKVSGFVLHQGRDTPAAKLSASEIATATKSVKLDTTTLRDYPGKYQLASGDVFDFTFKDDQLYAQLADQPVFPVFASAKDKFFYTVVDAQLEFTRDENGKVNALILHQGGQNLHAARIAP